MDSNKIKRLATGAREALRKEVAAKLDAALAEGSRARLENTQAVHDIEKVIKETSYEKVVDSAAYTWFNRLCALRFMDANGYTPVGVVTPKADSTQPAILADAMQGVFDLSFGFDSLVRDKVSDLLLGIAPSDNPTEAAYDVLLKAVCDYYAKPMPYLFKEERASSLLMPSGLLAQDSILRKIITEMDNETCNSVEVLGWLYQFYVAERKDEIFASKKKRGADEIPAATQLFTPNWIVRYMTENSLGRLWMLNNPESTLKDKMDYYIEEEESSSYLKVYSPEEITVCDPACGSGHILVYAFDLLYAMYEEEGWLPEDIPAMILTKNLFGFEIDERAAEIASFALEMKAREKDPSFFEHCIDANITVLKPVRFTEGELAEAGLIAAQDKLLEAFDHLDEIGSLYLPDVADDILIDNAIENMRQQNGLFSQAIVEKLVAMKEIDQKLLQQFSVVIANPPYLGSSNMNAWMNEWVRENYPNEKSDLCTCFIARGLNSTHDNGMTAIITSDTCMYIASFENMRNAILSGSTILTLIDTRGTNAHPDVFDANAGWVLKKSEQNNEFKGVYFKLNQQISEKASALKEAVHDPDCDWVFRADQKTFKKIPGSPIVYWASEAMFDAFSTGMSLSQLAEARQGLATADNNRFLRLWWEVEENKVSYDSCSIEDSVSSHRKWFPYNKGGLFRKWYGNNDYLVNWENDGFEIRHFTDNNGRLRSRPQNTDYYFKPSITWSKISSGQIAFRYKPQGSIFDVAGCSLFPKDENIHYLEGVCNSSVINLISKIFSSTLNFEVGQIDTYPIIQQSSKRQMVIDLVNRNQVFSKTDWDSYETSWDFTEFPLVKRRILDGTLEHAYESWKAECNERFYQLKTNEEELNRIFARIYNMEDEVPIEVPLDKVSVHIVFDNKEDVPEEFSGSTYVRTKADEMKSLISYGIGCIFGRYSTDKPGLILADQGSTVADFKAKVPDATFEIDEDGILPVLDGEWFEDDIVVEFKRWLESVYGKDTLEQNVAYIEDALEESLRSYFVKRFYGDHVKTYQKRPIYWLFSSPKKSFNVLVYLHRYDEGTVGDILAKYLRDYVSKLNAAIASLEMSERAADKKKADKYRAIVEELNKWESEVIYPMAHERISIDLDDGVKVNYNKFPHALRKIEGLSEW